MDKTSQTEASKGFIIGFLCAEKPDELNTIELEQHLAALVWVAANRVNHTPPPAAETALVLESGITQLVKKQGDSCACYRCRIQDLGRQMSDGSDGLKASATLFIGLSHFLQESAIQTLYGRINAEGCSPADAYRILQQATSNLHPGEILYINSADNEHLFQQTHMAPMMMHYLHHGRQFDGVEASVATLSPVQMLSPTWPR